MISHTKSDSLSPFLMTSVPKSGTYLLHQILTGMPGVTSKHDLKKRFLANEDYFKDHFDRLQLLHRNEFGVGHVWYSTEYADMLQRLNMKHIFIYRDPRDVLVSMSHYIKNKWNLNPLHQEFQTKYVTPKQRHLALIRGVNTKWPDFYTYNLPFYEWLNEKRSFHISFEAIIQSEKSRHKALLALVQFLWEGLKPPVPFNEMVSQMVSNINPKNSGTYRSGKVGSWKTEFDDEIKKAFKDIAGDLLIRFGYENTNHW